MSNPPSHPRLIVGGAHLKAAIRRPAVRALVWKTVVFQSAGAIEPWGFGGFAPVLNGRDRPKAVVFRW